MARLYVNQTLEKQIRQYCEINEIEDINAFANRCLSQGFSIIKYGVSPSDNKEREENGIKDFKKKRIEKADGKNQEESAAQERSDREDKEESKPTEEKKESAVTVRKIQIIKKG